MIEEGENSSAKRLLAYHSLYPHACFKKLEVFMGPGKAIVKNKTCAFLATFQPSVLLVFGLGGFLF